MKVIGKMTGLRLLEEITNNNLSCGTMIRYKREDIALMTNPPKPVYEYYIYTAGDKRFHRCNENGKLGAKGQPSFMNYQTLYKEFEIIEEDKEIEELNLMFPICNDIKDAELGGFVSIYRSNLGEIKYKFSELIKEVNKLKKEGK